MNTLTNLKSARLTRIAVALSALLVFPVAQAADLSAAQAISLSDAQISALNLKTAALKEQSSYLSNPYPAQAVIPLAQTFLVTTPLNGLIQKLFYVHGPIEKGEVIAELLSPELLNLQKDFLNTYADYRLATAEYQRAIQLNKTGVVSIKKLQEAQSNQDKLNQMLEQQTQDLTLMGMNATALKALKDTRQLQPSLIEIKSPISGELFDLQAKIGERLHANDPIISVGRVDPIVIDANIPTEDADTLTEGQSVQIILGKQTKTASIKHIANFTDPATQSVEVHMVMPNPQKTTRPGQFLTAKFEFSDQTQVYQTQRSAISQLDGQDLVFVKTAQGFKPFAIEVLTFNGTDMTFKALQPLPSDTAEVVVQGASALKALAMGGEE